MSPITACDTRRNYRPAPEGLHNAVCVDVIDLGVRESRYGPGPKVEMRWQVEGVDADSGRRFLVQELYTLSLNERAKLRQHLESWRGKALSKEELAGFDLEKLIGVGCQLQVIHRTTNGATFANVQAVTPLTAGMPSLTPLGYVRAKDRVEGGAPAAADRQEPADKGAEEELPF